MARITYVTAVTAYIDAGRADGVADSALVAVRRGGREIARLRVQYLSEHRAACAILDSAPPPAVGDTVYFAVATPVAAGAVPAPPAALHAAPLRRHRPFVRGMVAIDLFTARAAGGGGSFTEPGLELQLTPAGETPVQLLLDGRLRRPGTAGTETRVYQAAVAWASPLGARVSVGRQFVDGVPPAGPVDGVQAVVARPAWRAGVFAGTQPLGAEYRVSGEITTLGGFVSRGGRAGEAGSWSTTVGVNGSYDHWRTNREYLYLEGRYVTPRVSGFVAQEIDYYRPWKRVGGEHAFSLTSTFAAAQVEVLSGVSVNAGVDSRRNVRLFNDVVSAESTFDAAFRRGGWVGLDARVAGHAYFDLSARATGGGPEGRTVAYTAMANVERLGPAGTFTRMRATRYLGPGRSGWLGAVGGGVAPGDRWRLGADAGARVEQVAIFSGNQISRWVDVSLDVTLGRTWYATLTATRQRGGGASDDQLFAILAWRF